MRNMHKYEELTPYEFEREKERASIIYVAAGPMEYHEECNTLGIDPCKGYAWCLRAAEITGGIVFPLVPFAPAGTWPLYSKEKLRKIRRKKASPGEYIPQPLLYPGVMSSREVCRALYTELLETFADELKFRLCVFFGSHGPASQLIKEIVSPGSSTDPARRHSWQSAAGDFHNMRVMAVGSLDYNLDIVMKYNKEQGIARIAHGGLWETAINYAVNPQYYQPQYLDAEKYPQHYGALKENFFEGCLRPTLSEYRKLTPEFAQKVFETTVERFAADVMENYRKLQ